VAGTVYLKKGNTMSVYVYSRADNSYRVQTESGFGCHMMGTMVGFHADASISQRFKKGWSRLTKWRTAGNNELYASGGSVDSNGYYKAPQTGYYVCATQIRIDQAQISSNSRFRLIMAINGQVDLHSGLHVNSGNGGDTNYRSLRLAGTVYLKKGTRTSVHVYSSVDDNWLVQSESGFSCHMFVTKLKCSGSSGGGGQQTRPMETTTRPQIADGFRTPPGSGGNPPTTQPGPPGFDFGVGGR